MSRGREEEGVQSSAAAVEINKGKRARMEAVVVMKKKLMECILLGGGGQQKGYVWVVDKIAS